MKQFQNRMRELLPPEELPHFFAALERLVGEGRKALRMSARIGWGARELEELGVRVLGEVAGVPTGTAFWIDAATLVGPATHPLIASGAAYLQEASAMEIVPALDVRPGMRVLDLCAAPGGKSTQILDALGGSPEIGSREQGILVANEVNRERVRKLDGMLARWGNLNVAILSRETAAIASAFGGEAGGAFDRVLCDAPCSSESFFAKRREQRKDVSDRESAQFARLQSAIVRDGFRALARGGRLAYSTCTYSRGENEDVVAGLLAEFSDARLLREIRRFPHRDGVPGGYWAIIERAHGDARAYLEVDADAELPSPATDFETTLARSGGNVRRGEILWSGDRAGYAATMAGVADPDLFTRDIELGTEDARRFLERQWDADRSKETARIRWRGLPLGRFTYGRGLNSYDFPRAL